VRLTTHTHGTGRWEPNDLAHLGSDVTIEPGVLIFHPENVEIYDDVYVGHQTILKAYYKNRMIIGPRTWIGQQCFFHSAGGITIGERVGIGPGVKLLTSAHSGIPIDVPIMDTEIAFAPIDIRAGADLGVGAIILPGVTIGTGVQVGAGAVVTTSVPDYAVVAGVPARVMRDRREPPSGPQRI